MSNDLSKPATAATDMDTDRVEESKRRLLKQLGKGVYVAPVALAMMSTKASACSLSC